MAHGIARFSPKFCTDKMRFWSLGQSEASFWHHKVFGAADPNTIPEQDHAQCSCKADEQASPHWHAGSTAAAQNNSASQAESASTQEAALQEARQPALFPPYLLGPSINTQLQSWGLSEQVCMDITNPGMLLSCCAMIAAHMLAHVQKSVVMTGTPRYFWHQAAGCMHTALMTCASCITKSC